MDYTSLNGSKVLVIGASSFIGRHLLPALENEGAIVKGTFNSDTSLKGKPAKLKLDITDLTSVEEVIGKFRPDYIFNLSGYVKGERVLDHIWPTFKVNLVGTINLLMTLKKYPCKRVILMGSLDEHQKDRELTRPVSPYAASKIASSAYARMFNADFGVPVVIARSFMVYGPNQKDLNKLIPYTILHCLKGQTPHFTSGTRLADWIFIEDLMEGLKHLACHEGIEGSTIELGTGVLYSVRDIVLKIFKLLDIKDPPEFGQITDRPNETVISANVQETERIIGWKAQTDVEEGLKKTIAWYKETFLSSEGSLSPNTF